MRKNWQIFVTNLVTIAFTMNVSAGYLFAVPSSPEARLISSAQILIPSELGSVQEQHFALSKNAPLVVHIQDAHTSFQAQRNIRSIIEFLNRHYGFSLVLLEGGSGKIDPSLLQIFKDPKYNAEMIDYLMKKGEVNGANAALVKNAYQGKSIHSYGLESKDAYEQDLNQFRRVWPHLSVGQNFAEKLTQVLDRVSSRRINKPLRDFLKTWLWFKESKSHLNSYLNDLQKTAKLVLDIDLNDPKEQIEWPVLVRMFRLKSLEPELDRKVAQEEWRDAKRFLNDLKVEQVVIREIEVRLRGKGRGELAELPARSLVELLLDRSSSKGFDFKDYPQLSNWVASLVLQEEIGSEEIFAEIRRLNDRILDRLAVTEQEKLIVQIQKQILLLKDLFKLELQRKDLVSIKSATNSFSPIAIVRKIETIDSIAGIFVKSELDRAEKLFNECMKSYQFAVAREDAFFKSVYRAFQNSSESKAITVAGGFHTEGFMDALKRNQVSYLVVSPRINSFENEREEDQNYVRSLLQPVDSNTSISLRTNPSYTDGTVAANGLNDYQKRQLVSGIRTVSENNGMTRSDLVENRVLPGNLRRSGIEVGPSTLRADSAAITTGAIDNRLLEEFRGQTQTASPLPVVADERQDYLNARVRAASARQRLVVEPFLAMIGIVRQNQVVTNEVPSVSTPAETAEVTVEDSFIQVPSELITVRSEIRELIAAQTHFDVTGALRPPALAVSGLLGNILPVGTQEADFSKFGIGVKVGSQVPSRFAPISDVFVSGVIGTQRANEVRILDQVPPSAEDFTFAIHSAAFFQGQYQLDFYLPANVSELDFARFESQIEAAFRSELQALGLGIETQMPIEFHRGGALRLDKTRTAIVADTVPDNLGFARDRFIIENDVLGDTEQQIALSKATVELLFGLVPDDAFAGTIVKASNFITQITKALDVLRRSELRIRVAA